jgi:hypothetical protein
MSHIEQVRIQATAYRHLKDRLRQEFPDADDETLHDTLDGLSDLREMLVELTCSYLDDRSLAKALKDRVDEMNQRLERYRSRAQAKRDVITEVMQFAELQRLEASMATVSLSRKPASLVVTEADEVPVDYWLPQPPKLDRQSLTAALKAGQAVAGAYLDNGGTTLTVRTK